MGFILCFFMMLEYIKSYPVSYKYEKQKTTWLYSSGRATIYF